MYIQTAMITESRRTNRSLWSPPSNDATRLYATAATHQSGRARQPDQRLQPCRGSAHQGRLLNAQFISFNAKFIMLNTKKVEDLTRAAAATRVSDAILQAHEPLWFNQLFDDVTGPRAHPEPHRVRVAAPVHASRITHHASRITHHASRGQ